LEGRRGVAVAVIGPDVAKTRPTFDLLITHDQGETWERRSFPKLRRNKPWNGRVGKEGGRAR
jgi:hypothetical protein